MDLHPKIIKRQRARLTEPKIDSTPTSESSFVEVNEPAQSDEPADLEQLFESVEPPMLTESWQEVDRQPIQPIIYHPAASVWEAELREIRLESDLDVWESCPYD
jgi:hypothetical protein